MLAAPYLTYAAFIGETEQAGAMLRARAASLRSDSGRLRWFAQAVVARAPRGSYPAAQ